MIEQHHIDSMFSVREAPWHYEETGPEGSGRTRVVQHDVTTWAEARQLSGLTWDPVAEPAYRLQLGMNEAGDAVQIPVEVPSHKWIVRNDNGAVLASLFDSYEIITNDEMGMIIEIMLGTHGLKYVTGGALKGGRKVWMLLEMGDAYQVTTDPSATCRYVAVVSSHDGTSKIKAIATNVRIRCWNTFQMAITSARQEMACFSFSHRSNWRERVDLTAKEVERAVARAGNEAEELRLLSEELAMMPVTAEQVKKFANAVVDLDLDLTQGTPSRRQLDNIAKKRARMMKSLHSPTAEGILGTAYGLWQMGIEYRSYMSYTHRPKSLTNPEGLVAGALMQRDGKKVAVLELARKAARSGL